MTYTFTPVNREDVRHSQWLAQIWNGACGDELTISLRLVDLNLRPVNGEVKAGMFAMAGDEPVGFVLASALPDGPPDMRRDSGWIDAIAVSPVAQHRGIGSALLAWAENWLLSTGCTVALTGGGMRPFVPGIPSDTAVEPFFRRHGYVEHPLGGVVWDVARDLSSYETPASVREIPGAVRPAQSRDEQALLGFLAAEFPGRWRFECEQFLRDGGRISDFMLLWTSTGVTGFCRLTFEDSAWPIERYYPYRLPRPWGHLGPIGAARSARGQGFGSAILDAGLRRLRDNGVNGCVIDWTSLLDFYGKFGFQPYRQYIRLAKGLHSPHVQGQTTG